MSTEYDKILKHGNMRFCYYKNPYNPEYIVPAEVILEFFINNHRTPKYDEVKEFEIKIKTNNEE